MPYISDEVRARAICRIEGHIIHKVGPPLGGELCLRCDYNTV